MEKLQLNIEHPEVKESTKFVMSEFIKDINKESKSEIKVTEDGLNCFHRFCMIHIQQAREDILLTCLHAKHKMPNEIDLQFINRFR